MSENEIFTTTLNEQLDRMMVWDINTAFNVLYDVLASWVYKTNKDLDYSQREALLDKIIQDTRYVIEQHRYARLPARADWSTKDDELNVTAAISESKWQQFRTKLTSIIFGQAVIAHRERQQIIKANVDSWKMQQTLKAELLTTLTQMPVNSAAKFLTELIGAWCLSYPREQARQYFFDNNEFSTMSDTAFADRLFGWILQPFDYFK